MHTACIQRAYEYNVRQKGGTRMSFCPFRVIIYDDRDDDDGMVMMILMILLLYSTYI